MFEKCSTLAELNNERKQLVMNGVPQLEVNSAYNKAKAALMEETPIYRTIPTYSGASAAVETFLALPILSGIGKQNEIIITPEGVLL